MKNFNEFIKESNDNNLENWFGNSKVVDHDGDPLEVYHGTQQTFTEFRSPVEFNATPGFYFSNSLDHASDYGHFIHKVYLKIENPYIIDAQHDYFDDIADDLDRQIRYYNNNQDKHDGIIINNIKDPREGKRMFDEDDYEIDYESSNVYIVFNSNQIKKC
jgi:hypothetical protein